MREIKFRAWDSCKKQMHLPEISEVSIDFEGLIYYKNKFHPDYQERFKIMQSTGLKDKNGKEIYEGDFVCVDEKYTYKIVYKNCAFSAGHMLMIEHERFEIIGNIYENPELLEAEQ